MTQSYNLSQLANNLTSAGLLDAADGLVNAVPIANGGTGASTAAAARTNLVVPSTTGSGASGTWSIDITGSAASLSATLAVASGGTGVTTSTGTGATVRGTSPTLVTPLLGTPTSGVLTNCTGLPALSTASGSAPSYSARAWVNFDGTTASPCTIRGSGNVTSVTKNSTGNYTINFTTAMPDANYSSVTTSSGGQAYNGTSATGSVGILNVLPNTGSPYDAIHINVAIFR